MCEMNRMNEHKKRKYKLPSIFIGIVAISVALGAVLVLDMGNISGGFTPQNLKLANVNYDKYGVVATIIISMGVFITTYLVQDFSKEQKYQDDSFEAMKLVLELMKNSYLTLEKSDEDFLLELGRLKKRNVECTLSDNEIHFFQTYLFNNYDKVINRYAASGLLPTVLIEKYIRHKILFGKFVVQYIRDDKIYLKTADLIRKQLLESLNIVRDGTTCSERKKTIDEIVQEITGNTKIPER